MTEQSSPVLSQFRQYDDPSSLSSSASQDGFIANAVIRLQIGHSIYAKYQNKASKEYPPPGIRSLLKAECGKWLEALDLLPEIEKVKIINLYCQPALITYWDDMRSDFEDKIRVFEQSIGMEGEWEIVFLN
jgi:hypothetical protein